MKTSTMVSSSTTAPAGAKIINTRDDARAWRLARSREQADRRFRRSANPLAAALRRAGVTTTH